MNRILTYTLTILMSLGTVSFSFAQNVGINTTGAMPDTSAMLDIASPDKGLLIPRMDSTSRMAIAGPAMGLMVFDSTYNCFYYHNGTNWQAIGNDNLGDHKATQNVALNNNWINNDGGIEEGVYVDANGQVGIGLTPNAGFHVKMSETVIQHIAQDTGNYSSASSSFWQSFTPTINGRLHSIVSFKPCINNCPITYKLFEGEGTSGNLLFEGEAFPGVYNMTMSFVGVALTNGQIYTIQMIGGTSIQYSQTNHYPGGTLNGIAGWDMVFNVYLVEFDPGFQVSPSGVTINAYTLPVTDGMANQVLTTDGAGVLTWNDQINTDAQDLSLSGDSLRLTNDATHVDLNRYLDADDLGNHIATQNIQLDDNWLSNDGGSEGISINNNGDVNLSNSLTVSGNTAVTGNIGTNFLYTTGGLLTLSGGGWGMDFIIDTDANSTDSYNWYSDNVGIMSLDESGNLAISGNLTQNSGYRLKKGFQFIEEPLTKIKALNGYSYYWKNRPDTTQQIGVIAQEVETVLPQLVSIDNDGFKAVEYTKLTAVLIEGIKEQQKQIEKLEKENANFKAQLGELAELKSSVIQLKTMVEKLSSLAVESIEETVK